MTTLRKTLIASCTVAAVLLGGGVSLAALASGPSPAPATTLYGCVTGASRTLQHVYTNQGNYLNFLAANGSACPNGGFEVTVGANASPAPSPSSSSPTPTPTTVSPSPTTASPTPTTASPTPTTTSPSACVTSDQQGECGPYSDPAIEGLGSGNQDKIQVGNNIYSPIAGATQTLYANSPQDWHVVANMPAGNTGVVSYPSDGIDFHLQDTSGNWYEQPLTNFKTMTGAFTETMNATPATSAWAAYDIWLNGGNNEVMIQHDFANNGACTAVATATFGGSNGAPVQPWHLCQFGSELVWKLGTDDSHQVSEQSGSVDILAMLQYLETNGFLPASSTIGLMGYGWEICSTGGVNETFQVSKLTITVT